MTPPVKTFMEDHMPKGKKVALFCSFEGNSGRTFERMENACRGSTLLGRKEFHAPLKKNRASTLKDAVSWAGSIIPL